MQLRRAQIVLATGRTVGRPLCLLLLAEVLEHAGQVDEGLRVMAEALVAIEASGRYELLAEAYRLQGVLLLQQAVPAPPGRSLFPPGPDRCPSPAGPSPGSCALL